MHEYEKFSFHLVLLKKHVRIYQGWRLDGGVKLRVKYYRGKYCGGNKGKMNRAVLVLMTLSGFRLGIRVQSGLKTAHFAGSKNYILSIHTPPLYSHNEIPPKNWKQLFNSRDYRNLRAFRIMRLSNSLCISWLYTWCDTCWQIFPK